MLGYYIITKSVCGMTGMSPSDMGGNIGEDIMKIHMYVVETLLTGSVQDFHKY